MRSPRVDPVAACVAATLVWGVAVGCAKRPVVYPSPTVQQAGVETLEYDVDRCLALADAADAGTNRSARAAKSVGEAAATGGATGAVGGAFSGRAGTGAAMGAAMAGTYALMKGLFRWREPDDLEKRFVSQCLSQQGYEIVGWR